MLGAVSGSIYLQMMSGIGTVNFFGDYSNVLVVTADISRVFGHIWDVGCLTSWFSISCLLKCIFRTSIFLDIIVTHCV